jgi:hypothetical protein
MLAVPPDWLPESPLGGTAIARAVADYGWVSAFAPYPEVERGDLEVVGKYLAWAGTLPYWDIILAGGIRGYSLYLHELFELSWYAGRGLNPFDVLTQVDHYPEAHSSGLLGEHRFLQALACYLSGVIRRPGPDFSLRELILSNPHGDPPERDWDDVWARREELRPEDDRLDPARLAEAAAFYHGLGFRKVT